MTWSLSQNVCYVAYTLSYEAQFDSKLLSFRIFHLTLHHKPTTISYFQLWDFESWRAQNYLQCNIKKLDIWGWFSVNFDNVWAKSPSLPVLQESYTLLPLNMILPLSAIAWFAMSGWRQVYAKLWPQ